MWTIIDDFLCVDADECNQYKANKLVLRERTTSE